MRANRFRAAALKRAEKRRANSAPFARVKNIERLREAGTKRDLIVYTHPTKGYRSRHWLRGLPTFASKNDMTQRIFNNLGRVKAMQMQAGIGVDASE